MSASVGGPLGRPGDRFGQELADLLRPLDGHFESDHHCAEALEAITAQLAERVDFLKSELFDIVSRHHAVLGIEIHPAQEAGAAGDMTPAARMASAAGGALGSARAVESRALVLSKALQTLSWKADQSSSPAILRVPRAARAARLKARALNSAAAIIGLAARLHHLLAGASTALGTAMWVECALLLNRVSSDLAAMPTFDGASYADHQLFRSIKEEYVTLHTALRARLVDIATRAVVVTERTLTPLDPPAHSSDIDALFAAASAALAQPLTRPAFCSVVQVTVHARLSGITTDPERTTALQDVLLALHLTQDLRPGAGPGLLSPPGPLQLPDLETTFTAAHLLAPLEASLPTPGDAVLRDLAGRLAGRAFPLAVGDPEARVFSAQAAPFVHVLTLVAPVRHLGLGPDGASIQQVAAPGPGADPRAVADDVAAGTVYERASAIVEFLQPLVAGPPSELVLGPGRPAGGPMPELSAAEGQLLSTRTSQRWAAAVWPVLVGALHQGPYTLLVEHFATEATGPGEDAPAAGDFASRAHTSAQQFESYLHLNGLLPRGPAECGATAGGPGAEVGAGAGAGAGAGSPRWPPGLAPGAPAPGPGVASSPAAAVASLSGWWQAPRFQARVRSARRTRLLDAARRDLLCGQAYGHEAVGGDCARPEGAARQQLLALLDDPAAAGAGPAVDRLLSVEQDLSPLAVSRRIRRLAVGHLVPLCLGLATGGSGAGPEDISAVLRDVVDLLRAHSVLRLRQVFEAAVSAGAGGGPPAEAQLRAQCEAAAREGALAHNDFLYVAWVLSCFGTPELPSPGSSARAGLASTSVAPLLVALCREAARSAYVQMMTLLGASVCESLVGVFRARTDVTSRGQAVRWHCALLEGVFTLWTTLLPPALLRPSCLALSNDLAEALLRAVGLPPLLVPYPTGSPATGSGGPGSTTAGAADRRTPRARAPDPLLDYWSDEDFYAGDPEGDLLGPDVPERGLAERYIRAMGGASTELGPGAGGTDPRPGVAPGAPDDPPGDPLALGSLLGSDAVARLRASVEQAGARGAGGFVLRSDFADMCYWMLQVLAVCQNASTVQADPALLALAGGYVPLGPCPTAGGPAGAGATAAGSPPFAPVDGPAIVLLRDLFRSLV